jgi:hypothetical protein
VTSVARLLFRAGIAVHAVASLAYWLAQPRGFEILSRSFLEHQGVAPILFAVSAVGVAAMLLKKPRTEWVVIGILAGFWISSSAVIAFLGTTLPSKLFWPALAGSTGLLVLAYRLVRPDPPALLTGGTVAGIALAGLFWWSTWAPPATTRPGGGELPPVPAGSEFRSLERDGIRIKVTDWAVEIERGTRKAILVPWFDYNSVSVDGLWTIFQYQAIRNPPWKWMLINDRRLAIFTENESFLTSGEIWIEGQVVHARITTRVKQETASHLSSVMQLILPGKAAVEGVPWEFDHTHPRTDFVAIRNGRTELLRAKSREKGPFETLGTWDLRDPVLTIDGWRIQVLGWADQGSHAASPTAGWGVSQAAIERSGDVTFWSLANTSIGRGWHTVRTAPGVYVLEAILTPP